jgi:3-hydroxyisobutyrate dehydrogenase
MKIAFIGTGLMGRPMAERLLGAGHEVTVFNRTRSKAEALKDKGARVADSPARAARDAEAIILMLTDARAVRETLLGAETKKALAGKTVIQMSTIGPEESKSIKKDVEAAGGDYLEAPVLGSTPQAAAGELILMVGAEPAQFERFSGLLKVFGPNPVRVGRAGDGAAVKLAMNQLIATSLSAFALALAYVQARDISPETFMEVLRASAIYARFFEGKLPRMIQGDYANPHFPVKHLKKDVGLVLGEARRLGLSAPALKGVMKLLEASMEQGLADGDYAAIYEAVKPAGKKPKKDKKQA